MATYYINAGGSNTNDGLSSGSAFANFVPLEWDGSSAVQAGDTVIVEDTGGEIVHTGKIDFYGIQGSDLNPIIIQAETGHSPVINSAGAQNGFSMENTAYFTFDGLEIKNPDVAGIWMLNANNNTFKNCYIHHHGQNLSYGSGIEIQGGSTDILVEDTVAAHGQGGGNSDGFAMDGAASAATFRRCDSYFNGDDGFDTWNGGASTFEDCRAWENGHLPDGTVVGNGNGFKLGGDTAVGDGGHTLTRCIAFNNSGDSGRGFDDNVADNPITFYNCVSWSNDQGWRVDTGGTHVIRNCIEYNNGIAVDSFANVDDQYNNWNLAWNDPQWADVALDSGDNRNGPTNDSTFMTLSEGSPAIDAGTDVGLSFEGSAPDVNVKEMPLTGTSATDTLYNNFKELLFNGGIDLDSETVKIALVSNSPAYTPNVDNEEFVSDVFDGVTANEVSGTGYSRRTISISVTQDNTNDEAKADTSNVTYTGLDAGIVDGIVMYADRTNDSDSPLIAYLNAPSFPFASSGTDVTIEWNAAGLLTLG